MEKLIKKVKLNAPKSGSSSSDPTKGTQENPYTQEEFYAFEPDEWPGGWVEGMGYVLPTIYINSSMPSDVSDPFDSWDDINPGTDGSGTDDGSNGSGTGNGDSSGGGGNGGSGSNTGGNSGSDGNSSNKDNESGNSNDQNSNHGITYRFDEYGVYTEEQGIFGIYQVIAGGAFYMLPGKLQAYRGTLNNNDLNFKASFGLFKFLASHTDVEWAFSYNGKDEKNKEGYGYHEGVINTSHNQSSGDSIYVSGMDNFIHSHPNDFAEPSESDIGTGVGMYNASNIENAQYAYAYFKIYLPHIGVDGEIIDFTDEVISTSKASNRKQNRPDE